METYVPDSEPGATILGGATADGALDGLQAWKKEMKEKAEKDKAATDAPPPAPVAAAAPSKTPAGGSSLNDDGLDEIAKFKLMMKRAQQTPPAPDTLPADPAIAEAVPGPLPAAATSKHELQENGMSGLRRIMGKDRKNDDTVLRSAGFAAPLKQSGARHNDFADSSDFESGLAASSVSTSTPVIAQQATMDPAVARVPSASSQMPPATSKLEALFRDSAGPSSSPAVAGPAKVQRDGSLASASYTSPEQPRLFGLAPHAQAAMQNQNPSQQSLGARAVGGPSSHMHANSAHVQPELTSRLNIDAARPEQPRGYSPFDRSAHGAISPPIGGPAPSLDHRARASPAHVERPSLGSLDGLSPYPDRINTSSATIGAAQSDQPLSPQSAAGYGGAGQPKGSRFAKFFHERPTGSAAGPQGPSAPGMGHLLPQQPQQPPQPPQSMPQHAVVMQRPQGMDPISPGGLGGHSGANNIQDLLSMLQNSSQSHPVCFPSDSSRQT
ncbi:hypothetical protein EXIGLDRAFT_211104 [Exidia glandulosa HHB12029]|uniref:Uncharacterized protein n=1 Tax=Exidia glandulosa HHB12029 TaxID=1314781 RepID=A0A165EJQ7_EXIGL|nr:hypothetical protein EXIGLDRAFT_211104 [Exidia glandulosa HHB12029]